eukprot:7581923-Alexandrium_andersonii.AAC.1
MSPPGAVVEAHVPLARGFIDMCFVVARGMLIVFVLCCRGAGIAFEGARTQGVVYAVANHHCSGVCPFFKASGLLCVLVLRMLMCEMW